MSVFDPSDIVAAAREAGDYALARWRRGEKPDAKTWEKSPGHPVCDIDIAVDDEGNLIIMDYGNHRVRKVDPAGGVTTVLYIPGSGSNMGGWGTLTKTWGRNPEEAFVACALASVNSLNSTSPEPSVSNCLKAALRVFSWLTPCDFW